MKSGAKQEHHMSDACVENTLWDWPASLPAYLLFLPSFLSF